MKCFVNKTKSKILFKMSRKINSDVEQLIDLVKEYPIVYSKLGVISGAVNNNEKNQVWAEIAKRLNEVDPNKLKQKWRNLRDSYQKAVKYKRDLEEIGQLSKYHPYRHEERMSFLLPHILGDIPSRKRRTKEYDEDCKPDKIGKKESIVYALEQQNVEYLVDESIYDIKRSEEDDNERIDTIIYNQEGEEEIEPQNDSYDTEISNICYEEVESCTESNIPDPEKSSKNSIDDLEMWLSSVKASFLKLTKINRARAKRDINSILSKYEIEQYEAEDNL